MNRLSAEEVLHSYAACNRVPVRDAWVAGTDEKLDLSRCCGAMAVMLCREPVTVQHVRDYIEGRNDRYDELAAFVAGRLELDPEYLLWFTSGFDCEDIGPSDEGPLASPEAAAGWEDGLAAAPRSARGYLYVDNHEVLPAE